MIRAPQRKDVVWSEAPLNFVLVVVTAGRVDARELPSLHGPAKQECLYKFWHSIGIDNFL